jgi:hypothetical protein
MAAVAISNKLYHPNNTNPRHRHLCISPPPSCSLLTQRHLNQAHTQLPRPTPHPPSTCNLLPHLALPPPHAHRLVQCTPPPHVPPCKQKGARGVASGSAGWLCWEGPEEGYRLHCHHTTWRAVRQMQRGERSSIFESPRSSFLSHLSPRSQKMKRPLHCLLEKRNVVNSGPPIPFGIFFWFAIPYWGRPNATTHPHLPSKNNTYPYLSWWSSLLMFATVVNQACFTKSQL